MFSELEKSICENHIFDNVVDLYQNFFGGIIVNVYSGKVGKFIGIIHKLYPDKFVCTEAGGYVVVTSAE
jgi:hypothetical protein